MEKVFYKISRLILAGSIVGVLATGVVVGSVWWHGSRNETGTKLIVNIGGKALIAGDRSVDREEGLVAGEMTTADARPVLIRKYLEKYKSPLVPYSDLIFELSKNYGFEYYWIVAIAQQESNLCKKIPEGSHNCWGYGIHKNGTLKFENYELALRSYAEYLKREYFDKGLNTAELIMGKYCPHSNGSWAYGVNQFIGDLESGEF